MHLRLTCCIFDLLHTLIGVMWSVNQAVFNPQTPGNAWVCSQHCGYWCPGAKAPGHQYPQCWLNILCIGPVSYKKILHIRWTASENEITFWKKWPSHLLVSVNSLSVTWVKMAYCLIPISIRSTLCRWFSARLQYLQFVSNGDTAVLH